MPVSSRERAAVNLSCFMETSSSDYVSEARPALRRRADGLECPCERTVQAVLHPAECPHCQAQRTGVDGVHAAYKCGTVVCVDERGVTITGGPHVRRVVARVEIRL